MFPRRLAHTTMPQTVYCDEAGFTGENLLNRQQPFFAYASVAQEPQEAADLVDRLKRDYRVQGGELKGSNLIRYSRGRRAIEDLISVAAQSAQIVVHHKEYCLATKFFEYAFEPLISEINSIFYSINFHKFVGNILYFNVLLSHERAQELSSRFEKAVRIDDAELQAMFSVHSINDDDPIERLVSFGIYNRDSILRELREVKQFGGWILELTLTSISSLLAHWGDRTDSLRVFCDASVPLRDQQGVINMMVGRTDRARVRFGRRQKSMLFNLAQPIEFVDSRATPGVQIADVFATVACAAIAHKRDSWSHDMLTALFNAGALHDDCVLPEIDMIDIENRQPCVNYVLLLELVERSRKGRSLTEGIREFVEAAHATFPEFARRHLRHDISKAPKLSTFRHK